MNQLTQRIIEFNQDRVPKIVRMKYEAMSENVYRFYRGTNHIFYEDLERSGSMPLSPAGWICGDLHLENYGSYKGDNRLVYFDLNDFDEAILAPVGWELARMVTSIFVAFESLRIEQKKAVKMAQLFLKSYSSHLAGGKPDYIEPKTAKGIVCEFLTHASKRKQRDILEKRTIVKKNRLAILMEDPRHLGLKKELQQELSQHLSEWLKNDGNSPYNYKVTDAVFRLAGTGSVGVKRYAFLLKSLNKEGEKYLLLDMKESKPSSLQPYCPLQQPEWGSEAERIVSIQRRMQNRAPALLSTTHFRADSFVIQEMQPTKDSIDFKLIKKRYRDMYQVVDDMAMLTASSQLRSAGRQGSASADDLIAFGQDPSWQKDLLEYAIDYSVQVKEQYAHFVAEYANGAFRKPSRAKEPSPILAEVQEAG